MHFILSIFIPGAAYYFANRALIGFCVPLIGISTVALFSLTRWIIDPHLFIIMNAILIGLHLISLVHGSLIKKKLKDQNTYERNSRYALVILVVVNISLTVISHIHKSALFGFELFHVPSASMSPTIHIGDIVLTDTRLETSSLNRSDIIVFKRHARGIVLLKRLQDIRRVDSDSLELYVVGDNAYRSQDSRSFGWVDSTYFIGRVSGVLFSLNRENKFDDTYPRHLK